MNPTITISPDLCLKVLRPRDAADIFMLVDRNRNHLKEWLPWVDGTRSPADTRAFIKTAYQQFKDGKTVNFGVRVQGSLAGVVGFHGFDRIHHVTSLGYWLAKEYCGRGIMLRSVAHCIEYAFKEENMNRLYVRCAVDNQRSRRIPMKLGLQHEGTQRQAEFLYDHFVDLDVFSVLAAEWDSSILGRL